MFRYSFVFVMFFLVFSVGKAQENTTSTNAVPLKDRIYFGGGLGISFGTPSSSVRINPMLAYKITSNFSVGTSLTYSYYRFNNKQLRYETSNYGGSLFSRYKIMDQFFLHAEYAQINYHIRSIYGQPLKREWVPFFFVGGGYIQRISSHSSFFIQVLFDLIEHRYSPYAKGQPIVGVGAAVGF